jgi:hypothetical protein
LVLVLLNHLEPVELLGCVEIVGGSANVAFVVGAGSKVASPIGEGAISVGEHVIITGGPLDIFSCYCIDVHRWGAVYDLLVGVLGVEALDELVDRVEVLESVGVTEVVTHDKEHVIRAQVVLSLVIDPELEVCDARVKIVCFKSGVVNDRLLIIHCIEVEGGRRRVMVIHNVGEDLGALASVIEEGPLDPLALIDLQATDLVLVVDASEKPSVKPHLCKETGGCV